ncbi:hypothetical protein FHS14_006114 [Paenibacillus baekrokdamisoli]|nr:dihydroorotate dehydrogenase [Paenibacillus baekrokdamisoli]MBB3073078.1 hypothetical protein [Paenibacillus baekrokdamisoli]
MSTLIESERRGFGHGFTSAGVILVLFILLVIVIGGCFC